MLMVQLLLLRAVGEANLCLLNSPAAALDDMMVGAGVERECTVREQAVT